jgi:hypothetical protein
MTEEVSLPRFTLADAQGICLDPFLRRELAAEDVRVASRAADAARGQGVAWSGVGPHPAPCARTLEEIRRDARAAQAQAAAFDATPRGRFLAALARLEEDGHAAATAVARAAYARGFADPGRDPCPAEIGRALTALAGLQIPAAREACLALAELLGAALGLAAE